MRIIFAGFSLLIIFVILTYTANAQNEIEVAKGSGSFSYSGNAKNWNLNTIDLTGYQSGKLVVTVTVGNGKCAGVWSVAESDKFDPDAKPFISLHRKGTYFVPKYFSNPVKYVFAIRNAFAFCGEGTTNTFEFVAHLYNGKKLGTQPFELSASCKLSGINPASPKKEEEIFADKEFNGKSYQYKIATNNDKNNTNNRLIYVNGINTTLKNAKFTAFEIARITERPIEMVYNNSSSEVAIEYFVDNYNGDIISWAKQNALNNPPAADTLANLILERLSKNEKVDIVAYSQGAAITAEALRLVKKCLTANKKTLEALHDIRILTIGGAAGEDDFPKNVYVSSLAHQSDTVSAIFGDNSLLNIKSEEDTVFDFVTQHTNYFKNPDPNSKGDSKAELLLKKWSKGADFDEVINDIP